MGFGREEFPGGQSKEASRQGLGAALKGRGWPRNRGVGFPWEGRQRSDTGRGPRGGRKQNKGASCGAKWRMVRGGGNRQVALRPEGTCMG